MFALRFSAGSFLTALTIYDCPVQEPPQRTYMVNAHNVKEIQRIVCFKKKENFPADFSMKSQNTNDYLVLLTTASSSYEASIPQYV